MIVFNQHTTQSNEVLFSILNDDRRFQFICYSEVQGLDEAVMMACKIYPLNKAGEIVKVKNNSLRVQINQLLLKCCVNIASTGFKLKIHPLSGILSVQNSFLSHLRTNQKLLDRQFLQDYQQTVIKQFCNCQGIKMVFFQILSMIQSDCSFSKRQSSMNQMLKLSFNSEFYAWVSPNQQDTRKLQQGDNSQNLYRKQHEVWSDCDSDFQQFSGKDSQTNQSIENRERQQKIEEKMFSEFYYRNRDRYNKHNVSSQRKRSDEGLSVNFGALSQNLFIRFFISERDDRALYYKYLQKYVLATQSSCDQLKQQISDKQTSKKYGPNYFFDALNKKQKHQANQQEQLNLRIYLENNKLSISKLSMWTIVLGLVQRIYKDFLTKQLKPKKDYCDMSMYEVQRGLYIIWKQKSQIYNRSIIPKKVRALEEPEMDGQSMNPIEQYIMEEDKQAMKEQEDQKNVASIMLSSICSLTLPPTIFLNRIMSKKSQEFHGNHLQEENLSKMTQCEFKMVKSMNLEFQAVFLQLHQRTQQIDKAPFGDWVLIMCQFMHQVAQSNQLICQS